MKIGKIEYRVRPVTRYVVTRYHESAEGKIGGSEAKGEYDSAQTAYDVAYALCKDEHERLGFPPDDERIIYPLPLQALDSTLPRSIHKTSVSTA